MTYAAVASLSETIKIILNYHQQSISPFFKTQITYLQEHTVFLRSFLEDSPDEARVWEDRMREATIEAEDIIELLLSTVGSSDPRLKWAKHELPDYYDELERVTKKIELIVEGVKGRTKDVGGVDDGLMEIIDQICGGSSALESIPIVGIGGIGKTTLTRLAYNHRSILKHFWIRGWVTVSQNYSWRGIILGLLHSMNQLTTEHMNLRDEELFRILFDHLVGKKYLIVLDDLWSAEVWDWLKDHIPFDFNGSRILITSRLSDVACCVGFYGRVHEMCLWNEDQSWNLLRQKIFEGDPCPAKLEWIGKMIAGSCIGVPLAIEVVSGILAANLTPAAWEDIAENIKRQTAIDCEADDEHVLRILRLSYAYLPPHLRPCLLYFGIFPEGQTIRAYKLIPLWEAEGFVNDSESESIEGIGEKYLEDLAVKRNLVRVRKIKDVNGTITIVGVHDMVREMCIRQARADKFCVHVGRNIDLPVEAIELERRLGIYENYNGILENVNGSTIRTIICLEGNQQGFRQLLGCSRLLRILDFSHDPYSMNKIDLSEELFELFHLRYLAFSFVSHIPKAISKLENLQTLIINSILSVELPEEVWRMRQLRCVFVRYHVEKLETQIKTIHLNCSSLTLKMSPSPRHRLPFGSLRYSQKLKADAIRLMRIVTYRYLKMEPAFHPSLKTLSLSRLELPWEYMSIVASFPKLQTLKLENGCCRGSTWKTNEGGFCELEYLRIHDSDVIDWITESSHFPKLRFLELSACSDLREIPDAMWQIPTLEWIELIGKSSSLWASAIRIRHQQQSLGNHSFQLRFSEPSTSRF